MTGGMTGKLRFILGFKQRSYKSRVEQLKLLRRPHYFGRESSHASRATVATESLPLRYFHGPQEEDPANRSDLL